MGYERMTTAQDSQNEDICDAEDSCLAAKLKHLAPLSDAEVQLLATLEDDQEDVDAGTVLVERQGKIEELFILKKGWALASRDEPDGRECVPTIYYPGDIIGLSDVPFDYSPHRVYAATPAKLCRFPRKRLSDVLRQSPRLSGMILALGMIEQSMLNDRIMVSRRTDGHLRLVLFLLQTMSRLRLMEPVLRDQFHCPLTQEQIGAATGLSAVHVSRSIKKLVELNLVERHKRFFRLSDEAGLDELVDYENRYDKLNLDWLPSE